VERLRVAFVVNPIAGMGGKVGLKGTDHQEAEARRRGAEPVAPGRAARFLERLAELQTAGAMPEAPRWLTAASAMGEDALRDAGFTDIEIIHRPASGTTAADTEAAVRAALERGAQVVVFCGGDGTARDVARAARETKVPQGVVPLLGVPSGVKMHSAVFAVNPGAAADLLAAFALGEAALAEAELLDVDEEAYGRGEWKVKLFAMAPTLSEPHLRQVGKMTFEAEDEASQQAALADHIAEMARQHPQGLLLLGPGGTLEAVKRRLGLEPTLLGFDAWRAGQQAGRDLDERGLLALLAPGPEAFLLLSPIGAQGFLLGRGNAQASPDVVRKVGLERLVALATPSKLQATPVLRVDTGDAALDQALRDRGYLPVVVGLRTSRMVRVE